ncbi:MAG: fumarylacetoacetate hydrolase family protein [Holophagales bacterium]|nr:fumarylacetoacetate hydrolase family protein [Holophagales bacterium]MYG32031.1 fumarylacetoacetate hydrolase family protein [Holophagales bacterium]MYI80455.1 fumarylacetoacetate hydrolase family protein [Holophagales bacterium]
MAREANGGELEILDLPYEDLGEALRADPELGTVREAQAKRRRAPGNVTLRAPVLRPGKVIGMGINFHSHVEETSEFLKARGIEPPSEPVFFLAPGSAVIGPGEEIVLPAVAPDQVDYEIELAAVIGVGGASIDEDDALRHVAGYTLANDVSARDLQRKSFEGPEYSLSHAKGLDTFKPMGPALVTTDEFAEPLDIRLRARVNGELRQDERTTDFVHSVSRCVAHVSRFMRLEPGDVMLTGSPAGVGVFQGKFLRAGDVVELEADRVGVLRNVVAAA